jgi:hypothetical protein
VVELWEMLVRAEDRTRYEESGRAYILAGLSSHSSQRATARGDSTELTGLVHTYQTPSMVNMSHRSQRRLRGSDGGGGVSSSMVGRSWSSG